ncbi:hypothetical protein N9R29_01275 [Gammaproteobacteria bacterium]|nr:hypothetical protein [Gammaproteobacteria bacterium]
MAWSEFSETLFKPKFDEAGILLRPCENTVRPQEYFNLRNLSIGPNFVKVFPSIFVGIGLSLTFLGLIAALSEAVVAINVTSGNTTSIQSAIANLLRISSAKFYASLFALFTSITMTLSLRVMSWYLSTSLARLNQALEASVRYLGPEKLSLITNELLLEQLNQLKTFNTDLALKIGEQVQVSLSQSLAPVVEKLDNMGGNMAQQSIDAIKDIAEEVTRGIEGAAGGSMDRVAETLDEVSTKLGGLSETLGGALSNFDADFKEMLNGLKESLKESADGVSAGISDSMEHMSEGIGKTAADVSQIIVGLTATMQNIANTGAEVSKQGGEELRKQVEAASKQASDQMSRAGQDLATGFKESTSELVSTMAGATSQLKQLEVGLIGLPAQLGDVNSKLSTSAEQIGIASEQFGAATNGIKGIIEPLAKYASETHQSIIEITTSMQLVSSEVSEASIGISRAVDSLSTEISAQLERLDGADEQLAKLLMGIEDSTTRVLGEVNKFVSEVDSGFSSSVGMLQETIGEFEEVIDSVGKLIKETREG